MLATDYQAKNLDDVIPTHLNQAQQQALWHILKKRIPFYFPETGKTTLQTSSS
jgi:hypothetical protein